MSVSLWSRFQKWWDEPQFYTITVSSEREALELAAEVEQLWPGAQTRITPATQPPDPSTAESADAP